MFLGLIVVFIAGLVIGSAAEFIYKSIERKKLVLPQMVSLQMYAYTAVLLYFLYFWQISLLYKILVMLIFTTGLEYTLGHYLLKYKNVRDWNYSAGWLNYKGLICFKFSLLWLLMSLLTYYTLIPLVINLNI